MIMQIRYLTFVKRDWFTLPVNVWLKATTTISNKHSVNFILKKQQIDNNDNSSDDNDDNNDISDSEQILYWENDDVCWKLTMSESSLNSFENCLISSKLHIRLWASSKFSPLFLYKQKCFLFFTQENLILGWRKYS